MGFLSRFLAFCIACLTLIYTSYSVGKFSIFVSSQKPSLTVNHVEPEMHSQSSRDNLDRYFKAVLWNIMLVGVFVLQHSGMASDWWKNHVALFKSIGLERAFYVCATNGSILLLVNHWEVVPVSPLWYIDTSERSFLWLFFAILHVIAWILIYGATLFVDIPELLGYTEFYNWWHDVTEEAHGGRAREIRHLLRHMRHPGASCLLVILWIHPLMTWQRFICSLTLTIYLLFGFSVTDEDYAYTKRSWYSRTLLVVERRVHMHVE